MTDLGDTASAVADQLTRYADVAHEINEALAYQARILSADLDTFTANCTEYQTGVGRALAEDLHAYVRRVAPIDEQVRRVADAFREADRGLGGTEISMGSAPTASPQEPRPASFLDELDQWEDDNDDGIHGLLASLGMAPGVGEAFDLADAVYYAAEGDNERAVLALSQANPGSSLVRIGEAIGSWLVEITD
jgi:hypothetical protein